MIHSRDSGIYSFDPSSGSTHAVLMAGRTKMNRRVISSMLSQAKSVTRYIRGGETILGGEQGSRTKFALDLRGCVNYQGSEGFELAD